ncbi:MAG: hypothetical protein ABOK23_11610 [Candidatus Methanoperedens sp.]|nr:hypothetical protein [Candidatus Methanoperedens sp.]MCZ7395191.1 hypothetical protein [Candidatus Methanoperedens sp.]
MGKKALINLKRVEKIDAESQRIIKDFEKESGKPLKGFVLDLREEPGMKPIFECQCKCSYTDSCGGGGGGGHKKVVE